MKKNLKPLLIAGLAVLFFCGCQQSGQRPDKQKPVSDSLTTWLRGHSPADSAFNAVLFSYWDIAEKHDTLLPRLLENYGAYLMKRNQIDTVFTKNLIRDLPYFKSSEYHHHLLNLAGTQLDYAFRPDSAIRFYDLAIDSYSHSASDSLLEFTYMNKGLSLFKKMSYTDALLSLKKALEYSEKQTENPNYWTIRSYITNVYMDLKDNEKAAQQYTEIARLLAEKKEYGRAIINLSSLTNIYSQMNDPVRGLQASDRALHLADSIKADDYTYYAVYLSRAYIMRKAGRSNEALDLFDKSIDRQKKLNNPYLVSRIRLFKAGLLIELKRWNEARVILTELVPVALQNNSDPSFLMDVRGQLSRVENALVNYKEALMNLSEYYKIKDSIDLKSQALNIAKLEKEFETKEKDLLLKVQEEQLKTVQQGKNVWTLVTLLSLLASVFIIYLIWINRKRKLAAKETELKEQFHQDLIVATENEQSRIALDLHDGVASDLLVLKSKLPGNTDVEARKYIDEIIHDIRLLTKKLYPLQLARLGLCRASKELIQQFDQASPVFFSPDIDESLNNVLSEDRQLYVFRIIQEALTNVIKHAEAEAVYFKIGRQGSSLSVIIKDNGKGFEPDKQPVDTLGIKSMYHRAGIIGGALKIHSAPGKGTTVELDIPLS